MGAICGRVARLTVLTLYCGRSVSGFSATCTAPPARSAPPAAVAANLASADLTDMALTSLFPDRMGDRTVRSESVKHGYANCTYIS